VLAEQQRWECSVHPASTAARSLRAPRPPRQPKPRPVVAGVVDDYLEGVFDFFAGLLEVARIVGNRVEEKMVSVVAASAKTTE